MTLEDRLRQMVTALPNEASVMLPVAAHEPNCSRELEAGSGGRPIGPDV